MPLLSGFVAASPYLSQTRQRSTIFAVVVGTDGNEQLIELASDPVDGGGWNRRQLQLPATNSFVTLKTYTTRVQVLDSGMTRAAATNVQVTASHSTIAQINGLHYTIGPNRPATVATDADGSLTLVNAASGLGVPTYGFAIVDPLTTGVQAPSSIDPTAGVRAQLSTYRTGSQLLAAQTTTPTGTSQPLLSGVSAAGADQIASAVQAACSVVGAAPPPPPPPPSSSTGILADLGDIVQAVTDAFDDAVASIEQAAEGAWMLVVQIGETAFSAIISTAEDVVNCIVAVFNAVKTVFEDIFRWLAFLFNWQNILTIQRQLVSFYTALLQEAEQLVTKGLTVVASWIDYLGAQIEEGGASLLAGLPDQSTDALTAQTQSLQGQAPVARTDPRLYWGQDQVSSSFSAPSTSPAAVVIADETDPLAQAFEQLGTAIATVTAGWAGDVQSLINGAGLKTVAGELLEGFGSLVESFGSLLQAVAVDVGDQLTGLQSDLQTPLDIPLLSAIYSAITGGESLNVLSLACLLQAVPATLAYDIATDGNGDPANFLPAATVDQICTTLSAAADDLPQPPGSLQADAVGTRSGAAVTELLATPPRSRSAPHLIDDVDSGGVDPTLIILGLLHISRALSTEFVAGVKLGEGPAPPDSRKFFIADGVIWMFEGILDYANDQTAENAIIGTCNFCLVQSG